MIEMILINTYFTLTHEISLMRNLYSWFVHEPVDSERQNNEGDQEADTSGGPDNVGDSEQVDEIKRGKDGAGEWTQGGYKEYQAGGESDLLLLDGPEPDDVGWNHGHGNNRD